MVHWGLGVTDEFTGIENILNESKLFSETEKVVNIKLILYKHLIQFVNCKNDCKQRVFERCKYSRR